MPSPQFTTIATDHGIGITYTCGCPCTPTAYPAGGGQRFEHCCCGKVHFVGDGAVAALEAYLARRRATRKREPDYERGAATVEVDGAAVEVAWAFPRD